MALAFIHNKRPGIAMVRMSHKHSHTTTVTPPTCTEEGYTTYTCSCGDTYKDDFVDALGHDYSSAYESNEQGHWHICKRCGEASEVDAHIPDRNEATNTDPIKCTVCGYIIQEALCSHSWGEWELIEQETCTESGKWGRTCILCGAVEEKEIPALGHRLSSTITKFATCSTKGEKYSWCDRCGYNETETIPATGAHVSTPIGAVASTCTTNGSTAGEKCAVCDTFLVEPAILPFAPHTPSEWKRSNTLHWQICSVCGKMLNQDRCDKDGRGRLISNATCTENAVRYEACSVCGREYTTSKEVPNSAFGHAPMRNTKYYSPTTHHIKVMCANCHTILEDRYELHDWKPSINGKITCKICGYTTNTDNGETPLG